MLALKYTRAIRWVGWLWTAVSGLVLLWLAASEKSPDKIFWALPLLGSMISLLGFILERSAKSA